MSIYDAVYSPVLAHLKQKERTAWAQVNPDSPLLNDPVRWGALVDRAAAATEKHSEMVIKLLHKR